MGCTVCMSIHEVDKTFYSLNACFFKGVTSKILTGHSGWVFCVNYNTMSNLLVSGGCEGVVKIWNVARGVFFSLLSGDVNTD